MGKSSFLKGTLILLITSIFLRGLGFFYQIVIVRFVGTEPVGVLNMSHPFYITLVILVTAGLPVAIAKMTAEFLSTGKAQQIQLMMRLSFLLVGVLIIVGLLAAVYLMPRLFTLLGTEERVQKCFYILIPGIAIVPLASLMRGYFQGKQQMLYPSLAQVAEQVVRVAAGICLILWLKPLGILYLAMGLAAAAMLGELAGFLIMLFFYWYDRRKEKAGWLMKAADQHPGHLFWELVSFGMPVTFTRLTSSIDMAIEASLVPFCLIAVGYNYSQAAGIYGQFSGVAVSLITIPTILTGALATALVPAIAEAAAGLRRQELAQRCNLSLRLTYCVSLPVIALLYCYGDDISYLLFHLENMGAMLQILSFGAMFIYLGQTIVGILQGLGKTRAVFLNNFAGSAAKLIGMYYCIRQSNWGADGIAAGMVLGYGLQCLLNMLELSHYVQIKMRVQEIILPVGACLVMLLVMYGLQQWLPFGFSIKLILSVLLSSFTYGLLLLITGQFSLKDLKR